MRAHFGLPSVEAEDKEGKPPISVKFEIPYFTTSGIQVHPANIHSWPLLKDYLKSNTMSNLLNLLVAAHG